LRLNSASSSKNVRKTFDNIRGEIWGRLRRGQYEANPARMVSGRGLGQAQIEDARRNDYRPCRCPGGVESVSFIAFAMPDACRPVSGPPEDRHGSAR
jgi:hypothetical protein